MIAGQLLSLGTRTRENKASIRCACLLFRLLHETGKRFAPNRVGPVKTVGPVKMSQRLFHMIILRISTEHFRRFWISFFALCTTCPNTPTTGAGAALGVDGTSLYLYVRYSSRAAADISTYLLSNERGLLLLYLAADILLLIRTCVQ